VEVEDVHVVFVVEVVVHVGPRLEVVDVEFVVKEMNLGLVLQMQDLP